MYYIDATTFTAATVVCTDPELLTPAPDGYYSINGLVRQQLNGVLQFPVACPDCKGYEKPVEGELLLDLYPGAVSAYSLRLLDTAYTGDPIRVRRASDSSEQDIGFDVDGELDRSALATFCAGTDGFIVRLYDQSGNGNDAVQATTANQPKVYDSVTGVTLENAKPTAAFIGGLNYLVTASAVTSQSGYVFAVFNSQDGQFRISQANPASSQDSFSLDDTAATSSPKYARILKLGAPNSIVEGSTDIYNSQVLTTFSSNSTEWAMRVNGVLQTLNVINGTNSGEWFGDYEFPLNIQRLDRSSSFVTDSLVQEIIIYPSDQSANRAAIEANINAFYGIYWDGSQLSLLDSYPSAAVAYSLRALNSGYTGPLIRVRRASDSAEQDVRATYDGLLDTSALATFCAGTDGYIVRWYDQSGNGNDAVQATTASQPKVYDSVTGVDLDNAKPSISYDTTDILEASVSISHVPLSVFIVQSGPATQSDITFNLGTTASSNEYTRLQSNAGGSKIQQIVVRSVADGIAAANASDDFDQGLITMISRAVGDRNIGVNGGTFVNLSTSVTTVNSTFLKLGGQPTELIKQQEIIVYPSDQSANRAGIEANINDAFGIYGQTATGLLADYPGAAAAFSLRQLISTARYAIAVRRDSDDAVLGIGFVNGELDTATLAAFCSGANGFVAVWFDQSGNGNDATQATTASQPKIYDSVAGVVLENLLPIVEGGTGKFFVLPLSVDATYKVFEAGKVTPGFFSILFGGNNGADFVLIAQDGSGSTAINSNATMNELRKNGATFAPATRNDVYDSLSSQHLVYADVTLAFAGTEVRTNYSSPGGTLMHNMHELIIYPAAASISVSAIEANINAFYNIY